MICSNCKKEASHIKVVKIDGVLKEVCHNCSDISITGPNTENRGVSAIYTDDSGKIIPVDGRGNVVDKKDNPYIDDNRGWKMSGKKNIKY